MTFGKDIPLIFALDLFVNIPEIMPKQRAHFHPDIQWYALFQNQDKELTETDWIDWLISHDRIFSIEEYQVD